MGTFSRDYGNNLKEYMAGNLLNLLYMCMCIPLSELVPSRDETCNILSVTCSGFMGYH